MQDKFEKTTFDELWEKYKNTVLGDVLDTISKRELDALRCCFLSGGFSVWLQLVGIADRSENQPEELDEAIEIIGNVLKEFCTDVVVETLCGNNTND